MDLHRKRKLVDCESNVEAKRPHIEDKTPTRSYARARREEDQLYSSKQERPTVKLPEAVYFRAITLMSVLVAVLNLSQNLFFVASDIFYRFVATELTAEDAEIPEVLVCASLLLANHWDQHGAKHCCTLISHIMEETGLPLEVLQSSVHKLWNSVNGEHGRWGVVDFLGYHAQFRVGNTCTREKAQVLRYAELILEAAAHDVNSAGIRDSLKAVAALDLSASLLDAYSMAGGGQFRGSGRYNPRGGYTPQEIFTCKNALASACLKCYEAGTYTFQKILDALASNPQECPAA